MATEEIEISQLELADEILADMVMPVETATETKAVTLSQLRKWLGSSLPTGFILPAVGRIEDSRFTLLDGKTLSRTGTYEEFCNKVIEQVNAGNWFSCTQSEYDEDLSNYGQCGRFVIETDYVRIPTITRFIGATITLSEIGKTYKESLPNIRGDIGFGSTSGDAPVNGSFYNNSTSINGIRGSSASIKSVSLDASRSSSTYQDGAKVQPDHTKYPYYMVISTTGQTAEVEIDINNVYEDLNLKANKDLSDVSQEGKERVVGWGMPDYDATIFISSPTQAAPYTTPSDGYISATYEAVYETNTRYYINGNEFQMSRGNSINTWTGNSIFIPVSKGDEFYIKTTLSSGSNITYNCKFIPAKGVNNA